MTRELFVAQSRFPSLKPCAECGGEFAPVKKRAAALGLDAGRDDDSASVGAITDRPDTDRDAVGVREDVVANGLVGEVDVGADAAVERDMVEHTWESRA
jgi:hypothetical protein